MERKNKYTHLIERIAGLPKALVTATLKEHTGLPLSQNYWRLRQGKGLLDLFDQASLDMWSKLISDVRRFTGSPVALPDRFMDEIRYERERLLNRMEEYRSWLAHGSFPSYHYDCYNHNGCAYRIHALELALSSWLKDKGFDLTLSPERSLWTMSASDRDIWRKHPRSLVDKILKEQLIDWQEVYELAAQICAQIQQFIDSNERSQKRCEEILQDDSASENEKAKAARYMDELQAKYPLYESGVMEDHKFFYVDEIWQIRTDMDNRSSIDSAINATLLWICDIPTMTTEHRDIYQQNRNKLNVYKEWKSSMREQFSSAKKKRESYDATEIAEHILALLKGILVPKFKSV